MNISNLTDDELALYKASVEVYGTSSELYELMRKDRYVRQTKSVLCNTATGAEAESIRESFCING